MNPISSFYLRNADELWSEGSVHGAITSFFLLESLSKDSDLWQNIYDRWVSEIPRRIQWRVQPNLYYNSS